MSVTKAKITTKQHRSSRQNSSPTALQLLACAGLLLFQLQLGSQAAENTFCLHQELNNTYKKELGAVWFAANDSCLVYSCAAGVDEAAEPQIVTTQVECNEFYCEVGSELRKVADSCCGECIRTHCSFNGKLYAVGESWHNEASCLFLECGRLEDGGEPVINSYKRQCAPMPTNCPASRIDNSGCCPVCRALPVGRVGELDDTETSEDIWTPEFYRQHPCVRDCQADAAPMTCHYTFVVEWYQTLSKACFDCPVNLTDCARPHCVIGDGLERSITVVNRMMPGPAIDVCEGDTIVVDVRNNLLGESTTMHWHGLHQRWSPYMDGVPHITQCPIPPHASFRYTFKADNVGTHFWHSHTGMQRGDGVFGALIIRRPKAADPHAPLYDFDLADHVMIVQDWIHEPGVSIFANHHHSRGDNKPHTILVDGRGRYYNRIWEEAKKQQRSGVSAPDQVKSKSAPVVTPEPKSQVDIVQSLDGAQRIRIKSANELSRLARLAQPQATKLHPVLQNSSRLNDSYTAAHSRSRRGNLEEVPLAEIPLQVYHVKRGFRYRFRIINAEFLNCPIVVSVDNHTLTALNSDGYDFEAIEVGSIVTYAGERFDFVVHADRPVGNYWVRLKGLMDCGESFTSAFQVAILRYEGAPAVEPSAGLSYAHKAEGIELNVMNRGPGYPDTKTIAELRALPIYDRVSGIDHDALVPEADYKFFVYYDFYAKDNPDFHPGDYYGIAANVTQQNRLYTPQLNHISLKFPSVALLPARNSIDDSLFCNETSLAAQGIDCRKEFCKCHHVLQVPLNAIVEFIIVDEGFTFYANHPFHLHGNAFRVVGLERLGENVTIEMIKQLDQYGLLKRNLVRPPVKDTVTVPDGGYTIIRFEAYNPGYWLFHCHIEFHAEIGMALVLKVGDNDEMLPVPRNFPTCGDYVPDSRESGSGEVDLPSGSSTTKAPPLTGGASLISLRPVIALLLGTVAILRHCF